MISILRSGRNKFTGINILLPRNVQSKENIFTKKKKRNRQYQSFFVGEILPIDHSVISGIFFSIFSINIP